MDKKLKAKWVKALRSGKYPQSTGYLYDAFGGGYCCLGVLCKVKGAKRDEISGLGYPNDTKRFYDIIDPKVAKQLASLNDKKVPFEMLAGLISEAL